jgi:hypothetical protein
MKNIQNKVVLRLPTDNHPLAKMFNWLKSQGFYSQFADYQDYRADPDRPVPEKPKNVAQIQL